MNMFKKILYYLLSIIISIFFINTITFFLVELIPGEVYDLSHIKSQAVLENIEEKYELNKPISYRYFKMLKNTYIFDFGNSFFSEGRSVNDIIKNHFPISAKLGLLTIIYSIILGVFNGIIISKYEKVKKIFFLYFVIMISIPNFILAAILQYALCVKIQLFPIIWQDNIMNYILPCITLGTYPIIFIAKLTSESIDKVKNMDFVMAAKARGIDDKTILFKYVLKNAITPTLSYLGTIIANLLVGSFVVENIFNIPGLGKYFVTYVMNKDYPVVMGLTLFYSILLIVSTYAIDLIVFINDSKGKKDEVDIKI